jgi:hypothetical protein
LAGLEERALGRGEFEIVAACPVKRGGQARAAVQLAGIAAGALPFSCGRAQVAAHLAPLGVVLQPAAQPWPLAQQRLVCDLDLALADREQAPVDELVEHGPGLWLELVEGDASAHDGVAVALSREPQEDRPRDPPLAVVEPFVAAFGQSPDRAAHAAGLLVGGQAQPPALAALPELEQRGGQQRESPGLVVDVGDQGIDELGVHKQSGAPGGQFDRSAQFIAAHRSDEDVIGAEQLR